MTRVRLDQLLVRRGLADSRERAQRLVLAGRVRVDGRPAGKPGHAVAEEVEVAVTEAERYVGRGGTKLEAALRHFALDVAGLTAVDVGASTGGFTDCLLQHGAARVYAVDVGRGQLHARLRADPRVVVREGLNARRLRTDDLDGERPALAVVDVAFISLTAVLPAVTEALAPGARLITLIKPQFEAGRAQVGRGGVVRDPAVHGEVIERVRAFGTGRLGLRWLGVCPSPLRGPAGNVEFLAGWEKP